MSDLANALRSELEGLAAESYDLGFIEGLKAAKRIADEIIRRGIHGRYIAEALQMAIDNPPPPFESLGSRP